MDNIGVGYYLPEYNWSIFKHKEEYVIRCRQEGDILSVNIIITNTINNFASDLREKFRWLR